MNSSRKIRRVSSGVRAVLALVCVMICSASRVSVAAADPWSFFKPTIESSQPKLVKVFGAGAGRVESYATGILVSGEGHVLTTQGAILDGQQVRVLTADGTAHVATVLRRDRRRKLALLKITANTPQHFKLSQEPIGQKGDWVVAVSNAFRVADKDEPLSVMMGIVSLRTSIQARLNTRDVAYEGDLILIDAITSNPGAGGGAVLDADGRLIGMIGKIINSSETNTRLNYAVPTPTLYRFVNEKLVAKQAVEKSQPRNPTENIDLGIRIFRLGGKRDPAYVDRVVSKSPAAVAGLKPDDLIVSVGGEKIGTVRQYDQVIALPQDSHEIVVVVKRGKKLLRFILKLAEPSS